MKFIDVLRVLSLPKWSQKNISDAERGLPNGSCNDNPVDELKAFLDIAHNKYVSGEWGIFTYLDYVLRETGRALRDK
jgi:hypothetical protein